jgi:Spy/CpxP family protein refolding chaperone
MISPVIRWLSSALILIATVAAAGEARQSRQPGPPWWKTDWVVKDLQLKDKQIEKIDAIWNETAPELFEQSKVLDSQEKILSQMIKEGASEAKVKVLIEQVESTRARRSTSRQFMLYRMQRVMTSEQRVKFVEVHAKWSRENQRQPPGSKSSPGTSSSQSSQGSLGSQGSPGSGVKKPPEARPATPARP